MPHADRGGRVRGEPASDRHQSNASNGGSIPRPYPGNQGELPRVPDGVRTVGVACSDTWPCFWQTVAAPLSRQPTGLEVAPATGARAIDAATMAGTLDARWRRTVFMVGTFLSAEPCTDNARDR